MVIKYFAYGSNMFAARLINRVPSAKVVGTYKLPAHNLLFHKMSKQDGSGKCNAFYTGNQNDFVIGRLFTLDATEVDDLDYCEGLGNGYEKKEVLVVDKNGATETAYTYYATPDCVDNTISPFTWYKQHVLAGAQQGELPSDYIAKIEAVEAKEDTNIKRAQKEMALHR